MSIIFLDIDGVLVNLKSLKQHGPLRGDPDCIKALNQIIHHTGAKLVLSSTWRYNIKDHHCTCSVLHQCTWDDMKKNFNENWGIKGEFIGYTTLEIMANRGMEISDWLTKNQYNGKFVILDDNDDMCNLKSHLIKTQFESGLTERDALNAISYLNANP